MIYTNLKVWTNSDGSVWSSLFSRHNPQDRSFGPNPRADKSISWARAQGLEIEDKRAGVQP